MTVTTNPGITGVPAPQSGVAITGGTIAGTAITSSTLDSTPIGGTTRAAASVTTLDANGAVTLGDNAADVLLMTTNAMSVSAAGEVLHALQPAFLAVAALQSDVTGDGTAYPVLFTTEIFDQGGDFASSVFTAPVTGRYRLSYAVDIAQLGVSHSAAQCVLVTSNRSYTRYFGFAAAQTVIEMAITDSQLCDMDAGDTASVTLTISGSTKTIDINAAPYSSFSGELVA